MIKALLLLLAVCTPFMARAELPVPPLTGRVTDQTATLTPSQIQALEQTHSSGSVGPSPPEEIRPKRRNTSKTPTPSQPSSATPRPRDRTRHDWW